MGALPYTLAQDTTKATSAWDDPDMGGLGINSSTVWFRLVAADTKAIHVSTGGSSYDTVLAVFTGARGSLVPVASNDDANSGTWQSDVTFSAQAGTTYFLEIAGYGDSGGGALQVTVENGSLAAVTATPVPTSPAPTATSVTWYWGIPSYTPLPTAVVGERLVALGSATFALALRLALPVVGTMLLTDCAVALVVRSIPQMNVFVVGLPVKMVVGLLALMAMTPMTVSGLGSLTRSIGSAVPGVLP